MEREGMKRGSAISLRVGEQQERQRRPRAAAAGASSRPPSASVLLRQAGGSARSSQSDGIRDAHGNDHRADVILAQPGGPEPGALAAAAAAAWGAAVVALLGGRRERRRARGRRRRAGRRLVVFCACSGRAHVSLRRQCTLQLSRVEEDTRPSHLTAGSACARPPCCRRGWPGRFCRGRGHRASARAGGAGHPAVHRLRCATEFVLSSPAQRTALGSKGRRAQRHPTEAAHNARAPGGDTPPTSSAGSINEQK